MRHYLLVDDNRAFADNVAEIIRDEGDEVSVVTSGLEALALVRKQRFDAMLTDMRMPVMTGAELVHQTRRADPGLPAMVVTAYSGDEDLRIARQEGLLAVLQKPVPVEKLLSHLARARRGGLVVVVEDDLMLADNLTEALCERGFTSVSAHSVQDTERLGQLQPFAAVVDMRVPGGPDGEAARTVSARFPGLPQLVITAHDPQAAGSGGETRVFHKPFDTAVLMDELERLYAARTAA